MLVFPYSSIFRVMRYKIVLILIRSHFRQRDFLSTQIIRNPFKNIYTDVARRWSFSGYCVTKKNGFIAIFRNILCLINKAIKLQ